MLKRWLLSIAVLAATIALAGRLAWVESVADRVRCDELARIAAEITRQAAVAASDGIVADLDRAVAAGQPHRVAAWTVLEAELGAGPGPSASMVSHPAVLAARDLDFAIRDVKAAMAAWERIATDPGLPRLVRSEGWAGLVSARLELGDPAAAAEVLRRWLADAGSGSAAQAAAGLRIHTAGGSVLDELLRVRLGTGFRRQAGDDLTGRVDAILGTEAVAGIRAREKMMMEADAWWAMRSPAAAAAVAHEGAWVTTIDGTVLRLRGIPLAVSAIDRGAFEESIAAALRRSSSLGTVLAGLPRQRRLPAPKLEAPWDGMTVWLPDPPEPERILRPALILAIALVGFGLGALMLAAYRDRRLARMQDFFVSGVSHEMRTPLSLIRLYGEMLQQGLADGPEARARALGVILAEERRLGRLVEDVLGFARMRRGKVVFRREPVDLAAIATGVVEGLRPRLERDGFNLVLALDPAAPPVPGDSEALTQAITNLVVNAAKFSLDERWIGVRLEMGDGGVRLSVSDRGIGIDPGEHRRIFEPFQRVTTGRAAEVAGIGIGLALVWHVIQGHGGTVRVESVPGAGATFIIELPTEASPCSGQS